MICKAELCTGCSACKSVCPVGAITLTMDGYGFLHPRIDEEKCVNCNKCRKICPENNNPRKHTIIKTWAMYAKDDTIHQNSTSGGVASAFTKMVLENGGLAYGHRFDQNMKLICAKVPDTDTLKKFSGTKYVQSDMGDIIAQINEELKNGKKVFFIGSPCQVGGLLQTVGEERDNLLTVSFICGGVPSFKFLTDHIQHIQTKKYDRIDFRNGAEYAFWFYCDENLVSFEERWHSAYFIGFDEHIIQRESCFRCQYARKERVGDLTIGDFWGLSKTKFADDKRNEGVSVVLSTTAKGERFLQKCIEAGVVEAEEHDFEECLKENPRLSAPVIRKKEVSSFRKEYMKVGFNKAINKIYGRKYLFFRIKRTIKKAKFLDEFYHSCVKRR